MAPSISAVRPPPPQQARSWPAICKRKRMPASGQASPPRRPPSPSHPPLPDSSSVAISGSLGGGLMAFCFMMLPAMPISIAADRGGRAAQQAARRSVRAGGFPHQASRAPGAEGRHGRRACAATTSARRLPPPAQGRQRLLRADGRAVLGDPAARLHSRRPKRRHCRRERLRRAAARAVPPPPTKDGLADAGRLEGVEDDAQLHGAHNDDHLGGGVPAPAAAGRARQRSWARLPGLSVKVAQPGGGPAGGRRVRVASAAAQRAGGRPGRCSLGPPGEELLPVRIEDVAGDLGLALRADAGLGPAAAADRCCWACLSRPGCSSAGLHQRWARVAALTLSLALSEENISWLWAASISASSGSLPRASYRLTL
jgi:hypothetical protein